MDSVVSAIEPSSTSRSSGSREHCSSSSAEPHKEDLKTPGISVASSGEESPTSDSVREEGLRAFRAGDWRGATDAWSRGLRTLEYILAKEEEFDDDKKKEFLAVCLSPLFFSRFAAHCCCSS